MARAF